MNDLDVLIRRHKLDVNAYHRMAEAGILGEDDRVELIDGELIDMAPIGQDHAATANTLNELLVTALAGRAIVSNQNPVRINPLSEPQPDIAILRQRTDRYRTGEPPSPADVLLLIEVSDSSLRFDRTVKLPLYARAGIREVWIVDLQNRAVHAHRDPGADGYRTTTVHASNEVLALSLLADVHLSLERVFD